VATAERHKANKVSAGRKDRATTKLSLLRRGLAHIWPARAFCAARAAFREFWNN